LKFARMKKKEETVDQAMAAVGKYKGRCKNCSKYGHGSSQCWFCKKEENNDDDDKSHKKPSKPTNKQHIKCFNCQKKGHYQYECPEKEQEELDVAHLTFKQEDEVALIMTMLTIHTLSTADMEASTMTGSGCNLSRPCPSTT